MSRGPPRDVYTARTRDILVRAAPVYQPEQSDPANNQFTWSYTIEIENHGAETVQLVSRHWIITDAMNRAEEVRGAGVVGDQPTLKAREAYRYVSACPLTTSSGAMRGSYQMVTDGGDIFDAEIPEFSLHLPEAVRRVN